MSTQNSITERITEFRKSLGLNQEEMAKRLGIPPRTYQRWEQEEAKRFDKGMLLAYASIGVNLHWLLTGESSTSTSPQTDLEELLEAARKRAETDPDFAGFLRFVIKKALD